jgi:DNA-binding phage protein
MADSFFNIPCCHDTPARWSSDRNPCQCRWSALPPDCRDHALRAGRRIAGAKQREDWNVGLAEDLRDPAFVREFLLAAIDEGVDLQVALGKVIRAMGVKEFAAKVRMASPNLPRAINARHNPTQATLSTDPEVVQPASEFGAPQG